MLREAAPVLAISVAELDAGPFLLVFGNGTLDLRNSQLELIAYLQRAFGYSLTGVTSEKAVFFLHGSGDNGKSTLLDAFRRLVADYSATIQGVAARSARFAITSETDYGGRFAEARLKRITQGLGTIKAARKYENPVEFPETHKLWIDANHLPSAHAADPAIWRRLHLIPFEVTVPKEEQDRTLPQKLAAEAEGILASAVEGAMRVVQRGARQAAGLGESCRRLPENTPRPPR